DGDGAGVEARGETWSRAGTRMGAGLQAMEGFSGGTREHRHTVRHSPTVVGAGVGAVGIIQSSRNSHVPRSPAHALADKRRLGAGTAAGAGGAGAVVRGTSVWETANARGSTPLEPSGFSTGKGRPLCVSEEALRRVEHFFTDAGAGGSSSRREGLGDGRGHSRFVLVPNSREGSLQDQRQGQGQDHGQGGAQGQSKGQGRGLSIRDGIRVNPSGGDGLADKTVLMNSNVQQRSQSFVSRAG
ncbi:unnamed protein product, partial [Discosporangium mesarthrocarpum]